MRYIALLIIIFYFTACIKEDITLYYAYLKNTTGHQIKIEPYSGGTVVTDNIISLQPNQEIKIADGFIRGKSQNSGFGSKYFTSADSVIVTFDGLSSITHYFVTPTSLYPKHYLYTSLRNLGNYLSYEYFSEDLDKHRRQNTYFYKFTEQDYLDAQ